MHHAMNAPDNGKHIFDGPNDTIKRYTKEQMELLGKKTSNGTSKIGILPSASKDFTLNLIEQYLHIITNKYMLSGLKCSTKMRNR